MSEPANTPAASSLPDMNELLSVIRTMVGEAHPHWKNLHFTPDTHLERELGLDSMARLELHTRIESSLGITLDEGMAICANTPNMLMQVILNGTNNSTGNVQASPTVADRNNDDSNRLMGAFGQAIHPAEVPEQHSLGDWIYALYCWIVFTVLGSGTWLLVVLAPFASWRRKLAHVGAKLLFSLTFTPLRVTGTEYLDPQQPHIIVANHTSYLDGFIVTAALDLSIHFIVKGELARILPARLLLQRFGVEFVDRINSNKAVSDVKRIAEKSKAGQTIVFFPEGTFTTFPGLQPFRMGAFVTAVRTRVPVTPVAIRGARNIIRGSNWFPRRGRIDVTVRPPVTPSGKGWQVALDLRDAARIEIARYCGEPDLVEGTSSEPESSR
ncbi:MAG: 1-acyl-sn-glycerol-3-phosphate acyltransferase [Gammaproteobacteria bacterium]|nr:1-acyl-sn-glycerol-3-phosphate acyltransferase [Gammaproteobacteria bacterium]